MTLVTTAREEFKCKGCHHFIGWNEFRRLIITDVDRVTERLIIVSTHKARCPVAGCFKPYSWSPSTPSRETVERLLLATLES